MIIGERNLIIGKLFTTISDYSLTSFCWFEKQKSLLLGVLNKTVVEISPKSTSPPTLT